MKKAMSITIVLLIFMSGLFVSGSALYGVEDPAPMLQAHPPIRVDSDTDLSAQASNEGWNGSGTQADPYVIENYDIDGTGHGYCIYVGNTTMHLQVKGCYLHDASGDSGAYHWESGLVMYNVVNVSALNNSARGDYVGFYTVKSGDSTISGNEVAGNDAGIYLEGSSGFTVSDNNLSSNSGYGMYAYDSSNSNISGNTVEYNGEHGIYLDSCDSISLSGNDLSNNHYSGIYLDGSSNTDIAGNDFSEHREGAVEIDESVHALMSDNDLGSDSIIIIGNNIDYWNTHGIEDSNTIAGKPVYYWANRAGGTVPPGAGEVILANCTGARVEGQNMSGSQTGILMGHSSGNTIVENRLSHMSLYAMQLTMSDGNTIYRNVISESYYGLRIYGSSGNTIYYNDFINNTIEGYDDSTNNLWNSSYPEGGNYWSDYSGSDDHSGPGQNESGSDGIGDSHYGISGAAGNYDEYPHMYPLVEDMNSVVGHSPIRIDSDSDFDSFVASEGWRGNGSASNPYVIKNYDINGTGYGDCIYVGNVSYDFEIRGCYLHNASGSSDPDGNNSIEIEGSASFSIYDNTIVSSEKDGIYLSDCGNVSIAWNNISHNGRKGVHILDCNNISIENNSVLHNDQEAIHSNCYHESSSGAISIENNTISHNGYGVYVYSPERCNIDHNLLVENPYYAIQVYNAGENNRISHNTLLKNNFRGIYLASPADNSTVSHNAVDGGVEAIAIELAVSGPYVYENEVSNSTYGTIVTSSDGFNISHNTLRDNEVGAYIVGSSSSIYMNNISSNKEGIFMRDSSDISISKNIMAHNLWNGTYMKDSRHNILSGNNISYNGINGIYILDCNDTSIVNNTVFHNDNDGIHSNYDQESSSGTISIEKNSIAYNRYGAYVYGPEACVIENNSITYSTANGISIYGAGTDNRISHNTVSNAGDRGIFLDSPVANSVVSYNSVSNSKAGISIQYSTSGPSIYGNELVNNTYNGIMISYSDGLDIHNNHVTQSQIGINMVGSFSIIHMNNISYNKDGIRMAFSSGISIAHNTMEHNDWNGTYIAYSNNIRIEGNAMDFNGLDGLVLQETHDSIVSGNDMRYNSLNGVRLFLSSHNNTIGNNTASHSGSAGFHLQDESKDNIMHDNYISSNPDGMKIEDNSSGNLIYRNFFIDNTHQAYDSSADNRWNESYPEGGNYWSDYTGDDVKSGPNQDHDGSDGIGDSAYSYIGGSSSSDQYPLMNAGDLLSFDIGSGWSLIGLPWQTEPANIWDALSTITWDRAMVYVDGNWYTYNTARDAKFNSAFPMVDNTMGIWVHTNSSVTLEGYAAAMKDTGIPLHKGWNLVAYTGHNDMKVSDALSGIPWTYVETSDASGNTYALSERNYMLFGTGYWIYVEEDCVWVVEW